jgi:branched-chain amino acid transport system substrate-binding protein
MVPLYLEQQGNKAGKFNITLKTYDDATAAKGAWDDAACAKNATDHVANTAEVAVMGPSTPAARRSSCRC